MKVLLLNNNERFQLLRLVRKELDRLHPKVRSVQELETLHKLKEKLT